MMRGAISRSTSFSPAFRIHVRRPSVCVTICSNHLVIVAEILRGRPSWRCFWEVSVPQTRPFFSFRNQKGRRTQHNFALFYSFPQLLFCRLFSLFWASPRRKGGPGNQRVCPLRILMAHPLETRSAGFTLVGTYFQSLIAVSSCIVEILFPITIFMTLLDMLIHPSMIFESVQYLSLIHI